MRRPAFTLVEALVVLAICATVVGLLTPAFFAATQAASRSGQDANDSSPPPTYRLWTAQHDNHWWVIGSDHFLHHPDCPCRSRTAEAE